MPPRQLRQRPDVGFQLRDRQVAVDIARANPFILAGLIQRLNKHGVTRIVHATASARPGLTVALWHCDGSDL